MPPLQVWLVQVWWLLYECSKHTQTNSQQKCNKCHMSSDTISTALLLHLVNVNVGLYCITNNVYSIGAFLTHSKGQWYPVKEKRLP